MYSAVLVTALVTASTGPGFHRYGQMAPGCHGCYGCSSCYGCSGCQGYGWAGGCYGYHGGCYGGFGVIVADPYYGGCTGCYGCYGGYSCYGVPVPIQVMPPVKAPTKDPLPPIIPEKKGEPELVPLPKAKDKKDGDKESARATVQITVPEGGKLFVDGQHIQVEPGTHQFKTPVLAAGETYFYDIRIQVNRDGALLNHDRRVIIRPGEEVAVGFDALRPPGTPTARTPR